MSSGMRPVPCRSLVEMAGPLTTRIKRLTLVACVLGSSIALLDATVVNVALPAITRDLHGGLSTQQWIVDAYALTLGSLILVGGSLGDVLGEKRVFAVGVAGFGITSLGWPPASGSSSPPGRCRAWPERCSPRRAWP